MAPQGEMKEVVIAQDQARAKALWDELDRLLKEVAYSVDRTDLATINDVTHQAITKMLNTNGEQTCFSLKYVPSLIILAPDKFAETVLFPICDWLGRERPDKIPTLSLEEENKMLKRKIKDMQTALKGII